MMGRNITWFQLSLWRTVLYCPITVLCRGSHSVNQIGVNSFEQGHMRRGGRCSKIMSHHGGSRRGSILAIAYI